MIYRRGTKREEPFELPPSGVIHELARTYLHHFIFTRITGGLKHTLSKRYQPLHCRKYISNPSYLRIPRCFE